MSTRGKRAREGRGPGRETTQKPQAPRASGEAAGLVPKGLIAKRKSSALRAKAVRPRQPPQRRSDINTKSRGGPQATPMCAHQSSATTALPRHEALD